MSGPLQMLVDGAQAAGDWPLDRALQYGDGLFETVLVRAGQVRFGTLHRARLAQGCRRLAIDCDADGLWRLAAELARVHGDCTLKILVSRGSSPARGYAPPAGARARVLHLVYPAPAAGEVPECVRVVSLRSVLGENPALAGMKHCNRLEQVLARQELQPSGAFEGLMASSSGSLVSGTMSNVFIGQDGEYVTPVLDQCGVAGVMRAVVLREAGACGLRVRETRVSPTALTRCTDLFLTNARLGVVAARQLDGRPLAADPAVQALARRVGGLAD